MSNNAFTQQALASDPRFRLRLENALSKVAWEILEEDTATPHHTERVVYAQRVTNFNTGVFSTPLGLSSNSMAIQLASAFVNRPNVFNFETSYDFTVGAVVTAANDTDIESQLHTDWNKLAGVIE